MSQPMSDCPCREKGKDGTTKHSGNTTILIDAEEPPDPIFTVHSCDNHKDNYLKHGLWKEQPCASNQSPAL